MKWAGITEFVCKKTILLSQLKQENRPGYVKQVKIRIIKNGPEEHVRHLFKQMNTLK